MRNDFFHASGRAAAERAVGGGSSGQGDGPRGATWVTRANVFVDRKVAREERDSLPLVVDSADRIVWVVGGPVAEDFRVTEASQCVIFLKARRLGGQG